MNAEKIAQMINEFGVKSIGFGTSGINIVLGNGDVIQTSHNIEFGEWTVDINDREVLSYCE
jgi:hypothetical protein